VVPFGVVPRGAVGEWVCDAADDFTGAGGAGTDGCAEYAGGSAAAGVLCAGAAGAAAGFGGGADRAGGDGESAVGVGSDADAGWVCAASGWFVLSDVRAGTGAVSADAGVGGGV